MKTTITIHVDEKTKKEAKILFQNMGLSLSLAINLFLQQAVLERRFPRSLDLKAASTYPKGFFELAGAGKDLLETKDTPPEKLDIEL